jgi:hypothetical protein
MEILRHVCNWCETTQEQHDSVCEFCKNQKFKNFKLKTVPVLDYPIGTFVKLTKQAMKEFYMTNKNIDCYMKGKTEDGNMDFESFFESYDFATGGIGVVVGQGCTDCHVKVAYISLTGNKKHHYYGNWDLEVVGE